MCIGTASRFCLRSPWLPPRLWKHVIRKGDVVIDATCGNGHDTLALLRMVADKTGGGRVYAMDIQKDALESTSVLLDQSLSPDEVIEYFHLSMYLNLELDNGNDALFMPFIHFDCTYYYNHNIHVLSTAPNARGSTACERRGFILFFIKVP